MLGCGGDGTLHALAQMVAGAEERGERVPALGVAPPLGTANILAHALGCPAQPHAAAAWLTRAWERGGRRLRLGVAEAIERRTVARPPLAAGVAGRRYFLAIAGVGYDAALVAGMREESKRRWGKLAFAASACVGWRRYFPAPLEVESGTGTSTKADGVLFSLTRFYGGRLRLGRLGAEEKALVLLLRGAPRMLALQGLALLSAGLEHAPGVERLQVNGVAVVTPGRPFQLDGEAAGVTPVRLGLAERGIAFVC